IVTTGRKIVNFARFGKFGAAGDRSQEEFASHFQRTTYVISGGLMSQPLTPARSLATICGTNDRSSNLFGMLFMISAHVQKTLNKLRAGQIVLGAGITLTDPTITEALAPSVDFVWIDLEHNALTTEAMLGHLSAARAGGCPSIVRIPSG